MKRLFLDANIFFAATSSGTGASRFLFALAEKKKVELTTNEYALKEARKNIFYKLGGDALPLFYQLVSGLASVGNTTPKEELVKKYEHCIVEKDLPILLGAFVQKANVLITLDKKDFKTQKLSATPLPFKIQTPGEYLKSLL